MSRFPMPPYPSGWYTVAYTDELPPGGVMPLQYFGRDLVAWRSETGQPFVVDAHCPHLGAHLGHGGRVEGDRLRCPFHGWCFDGAGRCVEVPYARKLAPGARLQSWPVREVQDMLMVYFHPQQEAPDWEPPGLEAWFSDDWTPAYRFRRRIRTHCQEMAENSVDFAHFRFIHRLTEPRGEANFDGRAFHLINRWQVDTEVLGMEGGMLDGLTYTSQFGLGLAVVNPQMRTMFDVNFRIIGATTPIDGEYVDARFAFSLRRLEDPDMTGMVAAMVQGNFEQEVDQDISIWENKVYHARPQLVDGDGPIGVFRRWARQFYGEIEGSEQSRGNA